MISIKLKFRASKKKGKEGALYFQLIKDRIVYRMNTQYRIYADEWDEKTSKIINIDRNPRLSSIMADIEWEMKKLIGLAQSIDDVEQLIQSYRGDTADGKGVFDYINSQVLRLKSLNRIRCSETMATSLRSFMRFRGYIDLSFERINKDLIEAYEAWLKTNNVKRNSSSFYMRNLRTAYRMAVEAGLVVDRQPFSRVYTGVDKTIKRAISKSDIKKIKNLDLKGRPTLAFARDMFMFSFYTRGMPFVDMAYLRKTDLKGSVLTYRRKKTGQELIIEWIDEMEEIVERYRSDNKYILPLITEEGRNERKQYQNKLTQINRHLKTIGNMVGLSTPLSTYVSRHAWATIARGKNVPLSIISEALGHDNEQTTQIYLDSIKSSRVDKVNRQIIKGL